MGAVGPTVQDKNLRLDLGIVQLATTGTGKTAYTVQADLPTKVIYFWFKIGQSIYRSTARTF